MTVLFHHCWVSQSDAFWRTNFFGLGRLGDIGFLLQYTPAKILVSGRPSVILFFVLSGFVLTFAVRGGGISSYLDFSARRLTRILLPFWAAVAISIAMFILVRPNFVYEYSDWFNRSWNVPLSSPMILGHIFMVGRETYMTLDNPMWSLIHELRISLLFPLLAYLCMRAPLRTFMLSLGVYVASSYAVPLIAKDTVLRSFAETPQYILMFAIGSIMAHRRVEIGEWFAGQRAFVIVIAWVVSLLSLMAPGSHIILSTLSFTLGAAGLIALAASPNHPKFLTSPPLRWLGRVSFSLYLTHLLVLLSLGHLLHDRLSPWAIIACTIVVSLVVAELFYRAVEQPSLRLSRKIALGRQSQAKVLAVS